ncbi:MAG: hypothetical protein U0835_25740, partial [Isosphaeraceae bacterium]
AALVEKLTADETVVALVNLDQSDEKTVVVQAGGYAEHAFTGVTIDGKAQKLTGDRLTVRLAPGAGAKLTLAMKRYVNRPSLKFPWDRD